MTGAQVPAPGRALSATLGVQTLAALAQQTPVVLAAVLAGLLGVGEEAVGFFTGLIYLMALSSGLFLSVWINRFGAVRFSQVAMLACAAGLCAVAALSLPMMVIAALLLGLGYGLANPTAAVILGRHAPSTRRGLFFSLKQTGVPLGIALAGLLVPALLHGLGARQANLVVALICVTCAFLLQPLVRRFDGDVSERKAAVASRGGSWRAPFQLVLSSPTLRRLGLVSFIYAATQVCFLTFLVVYLSVDRGMTLTLAASTLATGQVASVIGRPLWGWIADRNGDPAFILGLLGLAMGLSCVFLAQVPVQPTLLVASSAALFCGLTAVAWNGVFYAELVQHSQADQLAEVTGGVQALTFGGAMVGPVLFSLAVSFSGSYPTVFTVLGLLPALVGALVLLGRRRNGH